MLFSSLTYRTVLEGTLLLGALCCALPGCKSAPAPVEGGPSTTGVQEGRAASRVDEAQAVDEAPLGEAPGAFVTTSKPSPMRQVAAANIVARLDAPEAPGYLLWSSQTGALAVMAIFEDTDGDGSVAPRFGQHGEPLGDRPHYEVFDTATGKRLGTYDEVLVWDEGKRFISLWREGAPTRVALFDALSMTQVSLDLTALGALTSFEDGNDCLAPRHMQITPRGGITLLAANERALVRTTFDAVAREQASVASERVELFSGSGSERIWRVEGVGGGWVSALFVDRDTDGDGEITLPRQRTSCACRFCPRFAMSFGFYGWSGDEWSSKLLAPDGKLSSRTGDRLVPLSPEVVLEVGSEQYASWPEQLPLGKDELLANGCSHVPWLHGATPGAVMMCPPGDGAPQQGDAENGATDEQVVVWRPGTARLKEALLGLEADAPAQRPVRSPERSTVWFAGVYREAISGMVGGKVNILRRLARVRVEDARVEFVDVPLAPHAVIQWMEPGLAWSIAASESLLLLDVARGHAHLLEGASAQAMEEGQILFARDAGEWTNVGMSLRPGRVVSGRLGEACVVTGDEVEGVSGLAKAPWRVQCVGTSNEETKEASAAQEQQ